MSWEELVSQPTVSKSGGSGTGTETPGGVGPAAVAVEPAECGRNADRAAGVGPDRKGNDVRRNRGGRSAARPPGGAPGKTGMLAVPVVGVLPGQAPCEFKQVGLAREDCSGRAQVAHD